MQKRRHPDGLETWHFEVGSPGLLAFTTTRSGGHSAGAYESLNLGLHVGDDPESVRKNRARLCEVFGLGALTVPDQQHGKGVAFVDDALAGAGNGTIEDAQRRLGHIDALITDRSGVALTIMVADCAPVVLYDPLRRALGVAHVGRGGAVLNVIGAAVSAMADAFGTRAGDLRVGIGPCIGQERYEIGGEAMVQTEAALGGDLLRATRPGHAGFDLLGAVHVRLDQAGIPSDQIESFGVDTFTHAATLFSDRAKRPCGRMMLVAMLR